MLTTSLLSNPGIHPILSIHYSSPPPTTSHCLPHLYLSLPPSLILDSYQLVPILPEGSIIFGEEDLEAPLSALEGGGKLGGVIIPVRSAEGETLVRTHSRYLDPAKERMRMVEVEPATWVWLCPTTQDSSPPPSAPDHLAHNASFRVSALPSGVQPIRIPVPVGSIEDLAFVEPMTIMAVWAAAFWVGWKAWETTREPKRKID